MSIPFSGSLSKSGGLPSALKKQVRLSNLRAAISVKAKYDPFNDKSSASSARGFMFHISTRESFSRNPDCKLSSEVVNDRSEPQVSIDLINGETVVIKTKDFTTLEVLTLFNKYVSPHGPVATEKADPKATKGTKARRK